MTFYAMFGFISYRFPFLSPPDEIPGSAHELDTARGPRENVQLKNTTFEVFGAHN